MATLILQTAGAVIGGPVGAMAGALIGQKIDSLWMGKVRGPRLGDLTVQTSTYGAPIPRIFGTMRVAGTVIWATDLREERHKKSGGKGQPKTETYSYSVSIAVALSARPILSVGRIWADGNILRGGLGDFKVETRFRLYTGEQDQSVDPMIAAAEGVGKCPAYRGMAYAVFEDLQLSSFGNRIPSLTFEVIADEDPVGIGAIISEVSSGLVRDRADLPAVGGIAVVADSIRGVTDALLPIADLQLFEEGGQLRLGESGHSHAFTKEELDAASGDESVARGASNVRREIRIAADSLPTKLMISHIDPARDYQAGVQSASRERDGAVDRIRHRRIELPATVSAEEAKQWAETLLNHLWGTRRRLEVTLPWRAIALGPGDRISIADEEWLVASIRFENMCVHVSAKAIPGASATSTLLPADSGRSTSEPDQVHGPTHLIALDLPALGDGALAVPLVGVFANGPSIGWRSATLMARGSQGDWQMVGNTAPGAILGQTLGALPDGPVELVDAIHHIDVELLNDGMTLGDADGAAMLGGRNLAAIGQELIQFERATPIAPRRYRLSGLWRGRRATEFACANHGSDEAFVLIENDTMRVLGADQAVPGVSLLAQGIGDVQPPLVTLDSVGRAQRPLSPVHLSFVLEANGDLLWTWIRRSREGWGWADFVDVPIAEENELYRVTVLRQGLTVRESTVSQGMWLYPRSQMITDGFPELGSGVIEVRQMGKHGPSQPTTYSFSPA